MVCYCVKNAGLSLHFAPTWREVTEHHHLINIVPTWHDVPAALFRIRLDLIALLPSLMYDDGAGNTQAPKEVCGLHAR